MLRHARLAIALLALWSAPADAQFVVTTDGYDAHSGGTYIEDHDSNIVLTLQRELGRNGMNLRGLRDVDGQWRVEYFCEPDTVLIVEDRQGAQTYYLPYLSWSTAYFITDEAAIVESRRVPSMGTFASLLPDEIESPEPEASFNISHRLRRGASVVETLVTVTNTSNSARRMTYVYQDGAYMWFPDGDQRNTESIRIAAFPDRVERYFNIASAGPTVDGYWQFAGTFNREHGVVGGLLSFTPGEVMGIAGDYVGLRGMTIGDLGYYQARSDYGSADIPQEDVGGDIRSLPYINRFVALDFGELQPNESKTLPYFRVMAVLPEGQRSNAGIEAWIGGVVLRMFEEVRQQNAPQNIPQSISAE